MNSDQTDERKRKEWEQIQQLLTAEEELREFLKDNIHLANGRTLVCIAKTIEALRNQIKCKIDKSDRLANPLIYFTVDEDGSVEVNPSEEI